MKQHVILTSRDPARLNDLLRFPRQAMSGWHLIDETGRLRGFAVLNVIPKDQGRTRTGKLGSIWADLETWPRLDHIFAGRPRL